MIRTSQKSGTNLAGRRVVITRASEGIGRELALQLAPSGAHLILLAQPDEELDQVAELVGRRGGAASTYLTDLTQAGAVSAITSAILTQHGDVDVLVNIVTQWPTPRPRERLTDGSPVIPFNFLGSLALPLALLPRMLERRCGHIIYVSSKATASPAPSLGAHTSTAAIHAKTSTPAVKTPPNGVAVTTFCIPSTVATTDAPGGVCSGAVPLSSSRAVRPIYEELLCRPLG